MSEVIHQLPTPVRLATPADEDDIFNLFAAMRKEHSEPAFDEDKVRSIIQRFTAQDGGIIGVIGSSDDLKACTCLLLNSIWYSSEHQLTALFDFVRPDSRSGKLGLKRSLINYAKATADALGIQYFAFIYTNTLAPDNVEAKLRIYHSELPKSGDFYRYSPKRVVM